MNQLIELACLLLYILMRFNKSQHVAAAKTVNSLFTVANHNHAATITLRMPPDTPPAYRPDPGWYPETHPPKSAGNGFAQKRQIFCPCSPWRLLPVCGFAGKKWFRHVVATAVANAFHFLTEIKLQRRIKLFLNLFES